MTAIAMELKDVEKSFGSVIALSDVSVKVREGAVTCILGDNGAGKSTLIKVLSGVHKPTSGVYEVQGEPVSFDSPVTHWPMGSRRSTRTSPPSR